jgi:thiosulfate dehydrogenase [quinone] large subunit
MRITRNGVYILTAVATLLYIFLEWAFGNDGVFDPSNPWFSVTEEGERYFAGGVFWSYLLLAIIIGAGLWQARRIPDEGIELGGAIKSDGEGQIEDPRWWRLLVGNVYLAVLWLPIRFFVGRAWLEAGEHKVHSDAWMDGGTALVSGNPEAPGFWERVVAVPEPPARPAITYDWYRDFIQYMIDHDWASWFAKLVAIGETLIGIGLLVGALVGIAAFFGTTLNMSFMLAGTTSSNPVLFGLTVFIILGWKVAGWIGLDRYLLPLLGTPWQQGKVFGGKVTVEQPAPTTGTPPQKFA